MNKEKIFRILTFVFMILTFIGAGYVLFNKGQVNAGFAVIPSLFCAIFSQLTVYEKSKKDKNNMKETTNNTESKDYVECPRCGQEVFKEAIICPFCKFGILAYMSGAIDENGNPIKKSEKN